MSQTYNLRDNVANEILQENANKGIASDRTLSRKIRSELNQCERLEENLTALDRPVEQQSCMTNDSNNHPKKYKEQKDTCRNGFDDRYFKFDFERIVPMLMNVHSGSKFVDTYGRLIDYKVDLGIDFSCEANHIPAKSAFKFDSATGYINNITERRIIAHFIPRNVHQVAMAEVGTTGKSKIASNVQDIEKNFIKNGSLAAAILADIVLSYGRANWFHEERRAADRDPRMFYWPAVLECHNELHAVVEKYATNAGYPNISNEEASVLHMDICAIVNFYQENINKITPQDWIKAMESEFFPLTANLLPGNIAPLTANQPPGKIAFG